MGSRGSGSGGGGGRLNGGKLNPNDIQETEDMVSARGQYKTVDDVLQVARDLRNQYGDYSEIQQFQIADLKGSAS